MELREYHRTDLHRLFHYWRKVGTSTPYFFSVSAKRWQACLLEDEWRGERIFKSLETYVATESGQVLGFVQYGQPNFAWGKDGKYYNPHIGVIRHLYFEQGRSDVGEALLAKAGDHLACFKQSYAFYHILGMSCNAHHGKLHSSQPHVDSLLRQCGFEIEHENPYYVLDMQRIAPAENSQLRLCSSHRPCGERFEILQDAEVVGTASVTYLDTLTDGCTRDTAYLTWIGVVGKRQGRGIGAKFLSVLVEYLSAKQYLYLHTDTASVNVRAQRFYERLGFRKEGYTRSYVQA